MIKYLRIIILLSTQYLHAQTLPNSPEQWLQWIINANPKSLNPLERELANHIGQWQQQLAPILSWKDQHQQLVGLATALKTQDVQLLEYLLLQEVFNQLGLGDAYEPIMWLVDASKKAQLNSKDLKNPFNTLSIPALPPIPNIQTNNSFINGALGVLNKVQSYGQMSHLERSLRLIAALNKLPQAQRQTVLSLFFGQEITKGLLPIIHVGDVLVSTYDELKLLESKQKELQELVTISNLQSFYQEAGYKQLLSSAFGGTLSANKQLPAGDSIQGLLLAITASALLNKNDAQKHLASLKSVYMHPQVAPLLLEIVQQLRKVLPI